MFLKLIETRLLLVIFVTTIKIDWALNSHYRVILIILFDANLWAHSFCLPTETSCYDAEISVVYGVIYSWKSDLEWPI